MANFDLGKLMEGKNPQAVMLAETRQLRNKWEKTGLLEGLKEREQHSMAVLLENQAKQLLDEATQTGTSTGSEEWSGVALPLVRRIFGEIAAKEFVSVQPMNLPSGLVFFLDFKYGSSQGGPLQFAGKSLFGGTNTTGSAANFGRTNSAVNGLYGEGKYGYSVNDASAASLTTSAATASWADVGFDGALSASAAKGDIVKLTISYAGGANELPATSDVNAVRSFQVGAVGSGTLNTTLGQFNYSSGTNVVLFVSMSKGANPSTSTVIYSEQPVAYDRGDFEDSTANSAGNTTTALDIPEIDLELKSEAIVAKTRKLKAVWTPELAQDLNAYHSIDAEAEFKINKVSNKIHQLTLRGGANFLVASPDVCTILESIPGFTVNADKDAMQFAAGVTAIGSMSNRYTVYKNPYMTSNEILLGFRGNNFLETGAVYAPYVPLIMTPLVYDPQNFTPRRGVMTRYAKKMVRPEFYGKIFVKDLANI